MEPPTDPIATGPPRTTYVEAPEPYRVAPGDGPSVFLAGGITGCPDWQHEAAERLRAHPIVVLNPRRSHRDGFTPDMQIEQVAWEYRHLRSASAVMFWFPACDPSTTVQPIALLELGTALAEARLTSRSVEVGADPHYPRRRDLDLQLGHALAGCTLHSTLDGTVDAIIEALGLASQG